MSHDYAALTPETIAPRLGTLDVMRARVGPPATWQVREVGDGNLNLVFIVTGAAGALIVKQALPYVRLVGESWPLPLERAFFEYHALTRQAARDPGSVPQVHHFDATQALIVMEYLAEHIILRQGLIAGIRYDGLADRLGRFCARTLFRGSDLHMPTAQRKADLALFAANVALCDITENLVFSDPYFDASMNRHTPGLDRAVARLRADLDMKIAAQHLKMAFASKAQTLLHGDLHSGSIMVSASEARVIDPEFATYGPFGFDIGMLLANFLMACCAQPGHADTPGARDAHADWILDVAAGVWEVFVDEFTTLWRTERTGILYQACSRIRAMRSLPSVRGSTFWPRSGATPWAFAGSRSTAASSASRITPISNGSLTRACAPHARPARWNWAALSPSAVPASRTWPLSPPSPATSPQGTTYEDRRQTLPFHLARCGRHRADHRPALAAA